MLNVFPFTAIVGKERMKRALVLNAISPQIGGVLIRGERGTAKSIADDHDLWRHCCPRSWSSAIVPLIATL